MANYSAPQLTMAAPRPLQKSRKRPTIDFPNSAVKGEIFRVARTVEGRDDIKLLYAGAIIYAFEVVLSIDKKRLAQY